MAITLKRDATGLCRCPDGSLAICADCDCLYIGPVAFTLDGVGPYQVPYAPDFMADWQIAWPWINGAGVAPWPSVPDFGGDSWTIDINIRPTGECQWQFSVGLTISSGGSPVAAARYESAGGHCWSGAQVLIRNPELGFGDGWPSALDGSSMAWPT